MLLKYKDKAYNDASTVDKLRHKQTMLKFYRKHIKLVIWLIVLAFVAWGAGTISVSKELASPYIGSVNGEKISHKEFLMTLRYYELLSRARTAESEKTESEPLPYDQLRSLTWQTIAISREAKRLGVRVSDEEVRNQVERLFSAGGQFNEAFYQNWIEKNFRGRAREFEEATRKHITVQKTHQKILEGIPESERETRWIKWLRPLMNRVQIKDQS